MAKPRTKREEAQASVAEGDPRAVDAEVQGDDAPFDRTLRPKTFDDYIGQTKHKDNLRVFVEASRRRGEPMDHVLLCGPPGLGKTTLAHILANEMGVQMHTTSGPVIEHKGALAALLTSKLARNDVLFIDEIHRLNPAVEESLYPAMDDLVMDIVTGEGAFANTIQIPIPPFTLVGATTRTGLLTAPLFSRFGHVVRLDFYPTDDLAKIVTRSAALLNMDIDARSAQEIAKRSRGTPRVANRLLRRVRDFAEVDFAGKVDVATVLHACKKLDVDAAGLVDEDRRYLTVLIDHYEGGPAGLKALSAALSEPVDTLEDVYEPYLVQQGYVARTPSGRMATRKAYEALGRQAPTRGGSGEAPQGALFE